MLPPTFIHTFLIVNYNAHFLQNIQVMGTTQQISVIYDNIASHLKIFSVGRIKGSVRSNYNVYLGSIFIDIDGGHFI